MGKLSSALGDLTPLRVKSFELGGHQFKVRIPITAEFDAMMERIDNVSPVLIEARYQKLIKDIKPGEGIEFTINDVVVEGRSSREMAETIVKAETRITEFVKLLVPAVEGQSLADLTYEEIEQEWPFSVQMEILNKISEAINPSYTDTKKN
jgi:hypothetical protein